MNILIFTGGKASQKSNWEHFLKESCFIIAADSGLDLVVSHKIRPDLILGDMDSLKDKSLLKQYDNIIEHYPIEKDFSDTELALKRAKAMDHEKIILIGGGEGRLDHSLSLLTIFENAYAPDIWLTEYEKIYNIFGSSKFDVKSGDILSFYGIGIDGAYIDNSVGLKWNLKEKRLNRSFMSLSNKAITKCVEIEASKHENYLVIINQKV